MGQLSAKLRKTTTGLTFWCPGCEEPHHVTHGWQWDGNADRPTFSPSVLVRSGHFLPMLRSEDKRCWCTYNAEHPDAPAPFKCTQCHSFVREGRIQFLEDCTHVLANQTVELPDLPPHMRDE